MDESDNKYPAPSETADDTVHKGAKTLFSAVPVVGGPLTELFLAIVQPPIEKRRNEWMHQIGALLSRLEDKGLDLNALRENEGFMDTVLQATQVALRTHQEAKREALRNAIANTALGRQPNEILRQMFVRFVDEFTPEHLAILELFADCEGWFERANQPRPNLTMGAPSRILETAFPPFQNSRAIYDQIWRDLHQRGLVNTDNLHVMMSERGLFESRTTSLGSRFLDFIRSIEAP